MYLTQSKIIKAESFSYIELLAEKSESFKPTHMQILVNNPNSNCLSSYVELCNCTVMGDPQFTNSDGILNIRSRGNSLVFKKMLSVDFSVFGTHVGQGLQLELYNPHYHELEVTVLLKANDLLGSRFVSDKTIKYLFNHFQLKSSSIVKVPLNNITRSGATFKCSNLQINSFKCNSEEIVYPYIKNIFCNGESQFENIDDIKLNSIFFEKLRDFEMKEFPSHGKGTYITLENPYDYDVNCYMTLVG